MKNATKTRIITVLLSLMMLLCCLSVVVMGKNEKIVSNADTSATSTYVNVLSNVRDRTSFNADWKFKRSNVYGANEVEFNDSSWESVSLPHCWDTDWWNAPYTGKSWYRKTFEVETKSAYTQANKRLWVEFEACGAYAEVYINGQLIGNHKGAYNAFRFDITDYLTETGSNKIAVLADYSGNNGTINMNSGGAGSGLYRDAWLIETSGVMVDMEDYGSSGLYLSGTKDNDSDNWLLNVTSKVVNTTAQDVAVEAEILLRYPKRSDMTWMDNTYDLSGTAAFAIGSEENPLRFDPDDMYETFDTDEEYIVVRRTIPLTVKGNATASINEDINVVNPKLWNGVYSPYRYVAEINIKVNNVVVDNVKEFYGFRYFEVNEQGFFLNGEKYQLNGVNKHQDFAIVDENGEEIGYATTDREKYVDLCIAYEMGTTYIRTAHYPQDKSFFDMCDAYGIACSAEVSLQGDIGRSTTADTNDPVTVEFFDNVLLQLTEMVKQLHNNPSVIVWGLQNEVRARYYDTMAYYMHEMNELAHSLDGNHRYTTQAICDENTLGWETDLISWNIYPGWYSTSNYYDTITGLYDDFLNDPRYEKYLGLSLSEFGAGSSVLQHTEVLERPAPGGSWHPEEWQTFVHEDAVSAFEELDYLWSTAIWQLFDNMNRSADGHGGLRAQNDKGLATITRTVKKDSFYLYKANWSDAPFVYIAEKRNTTRTFEEITVKCFSNTDGGKLYRVVNGEKTLIGEMQNLGAGIFVVENVALKGGNNSFMVEFTKDGKTYTDTCEFYKTASEDTSLKSDVFKIDNDRKTITLNGTVTAQEIIDGKIQTNQAAATFRILNPFMEELTDFNTVVYPSMKVEVTAENGKIDSYTFVSQNITTGKIFSSDVFGGNISALNDGNFSTKWVGNGASGNLIVDFEREFRLTSMTMNWYTGYTNRYYYYRVLASADGVNYVEVVDRTSYSLTLDTTKTDATITEGLKETVARYLKIEIVGCNFPVNRIEINEIEVRGWGMASDTLGIDYENKVITWEKADSFEQAKFMELLDVYGNATYTITEGEAGSLAAYLLEGNYLTITDGEGNDTNYYICLDCGKPHDAAKLVVNVTADASVEMNEFFTAEKLIDGNLGTKWVGIKDDYDNAWVLLSLDNSTLVSKIKIVFENDGKRAYDYAVFVSNSGTRTGDFKLIKQVVNNKNLSGEEWIEIKKEICYVRIVVLGCNQENASPSIQEVELYGYEYGLVTFVVNGGNPISATSYRIGKTVDIVPKKSGYLFVGWYLDEELANPFDGVVKSDTKLYAKWEKESAQEHEDILLTFVFNNGMENIARRGKFGDAIVLPVPTREGYVFAGWFADEECTVLCNFDKLPNESCTLYAKWVEEDAGNGCSGNIAQSGIVLLGILSMGVCILLRRRKV